MSGGTEPRQVPDLEVGSSLKEPAISVSIPKTLTLGGLYSIGLRPFGIPGQKSRRKGGID